MAVHVPPWTSDTEIETLIERFRKVGTETRNFGPMKIHPTTVDDPKGRYQRIAIYVFTRRGVDGAGHVTPVCDRRRSDGAGWVRRIRTRILPIG